MSIIKFALLRIPVAIDLIREEVISLDQRSWQPHLNTRHYEGDWQVLSLRSPGGKFSALAESLHNEEYADTPLMRQCPAISRLVNELSCEKMAVRLLNLKAGSVIKEHTDIGLCFEKGEARLHIPVITHPLVEFVLDKTPLCMAAGECWYINANLPHRLANKSTVDRIHLVVDCVVNEWLRHIFTTHTVRREMRDSEIAWQHQKSTIEKAIRELRMQVDNPACQAWADQLERQLISNH